MNVTNKAPTKTFIFKKLLTAQGWKTDVCIDVDDAGVIVSLEEEAVRKQGVRKPGSADQRFSGPALPGVHNDHSHAFQYLMAGYSEGIVPEHPYDDFWTWRKSMYELALSLSPDDIEVAAYRLYEHMLSSGYTSVTEFHYLHRDPSGQLYSDPAEISRRLLEAASKSGINLTLVPVYYRTSDFGVAAGSEHRRFLSRSPEDYLELVAHIEKAATGYPNAKVGIGFHSLRASPIDDVAEILRSRRADPSVHIHISEQTAEVHRCIEKTGLRPLELLAQIANGVDQDLSRFSLVHATHFSESEQTLAADHKARIVLCPSTEANLGDGLFPLASWLGKGGQFTIGSDSHVCLSPWEELRLLEYQARLDARRRNPLCTNLHPESGDRLFWESQPDNDPIRLGKTLNALVLDEEFSPLSAVPDSKILSAITFSPHHPRFSHAISGSRVRSIGSNAARL